MKKYKTIDLFSGLGGIRRGYELTGRFKNVLSADVDKYACQVYKHLYNEDSYNDVTSEEFKNKVENTEYDVLLGGFPCQSFSIAGLQKGFADETRGTLFFDIADILKRTHPKSFMLENVEGLLKHEKGRTFQTIIRVLDELGYKVVNADIENGEVKYNGKNLVRSTKDFGIPQKRARIFIMGFRKDIIPKNYIFPNLPDHSDVKIYNNLYDLLEKKVDSKYYLSDRLLTTLKNHRASHASVNSGFGYIVVNEGENPVSNTIMATGGSGKERNLIKQPVEEYKGLLVGRGNEINKEGIRNMTPTEWGKLQGFINYGFMENDEDKFSFPEGISDTQQYKLFGNSVSIPVIKAMAEYMIERLDDITNELYQVKQLTLQERDTIIDYVLHNDLDVSIYFNDELIEEIDRLEIKDNKQKLFEIIKSAVAANGSFEIDNVQNLLNKMTPSGILKSKSSFKEDLNAIVIDSRVGDDLLLKYSIKSSLGSPATILNASNHTNFIYEVKGLNVGEIQKINNINTRTKLIDRLDMIKSLGGRINFSKMECQSFDYNLRLIDSNMPEYLGDVLLNSYEYENKNLKDLFLKNSNFSDENFALKKLGDFLEAISFGCFPSIRWDGINNVNGGLIVVKKDGKVVILDLIYFRQKVINYLIEETKLDSPSSTRYHMLELYVENGKIFFKLNLQIRYKR